MVCLETVFLAIRKFSNSTLDDEFDECMCVFTSMSGNVDMHMDTDTKCKIAKNTHKHTYTYSAGMFGHLHIDFYVFSIYTQVNG